MRETGHRGQDREREGWNRERGLPSKGLVAEKTSMLHLRGKYSWVTLHPQRTNERVDGPARGWDSGGNGRWERGGDVIPAACWQLYRVTLRRLSILQPFESLTTALSSFLVCPPSAHPFPALSPAYFISNERQRVFGIYRQQPLMSHSARTFWLIQTRSICTRSC